MIRRAAARLLRLAVADGRKGAHARGRHAPRDLHAGGMKPQFFNGISPNPLDTDIVAGAEVLGDEAFGMGGLERAAA